MREEFRRKMREDIDMLGSLVDALDGLRERAGAGFDCIEQAEKEGWELAPMIDIGHCIHSARTKCLAFDAYFEEKYGEEKSDGAKLC
jgi:hypothetical protein